MSADYIKYDYIKNDYIKNDYTKNDFNKNDGVDWLYQKWNFSENEFTKFE